jgi:glutamine synthetase
MYKINTKLVCEYIWIGGKGEIRSKTRVIENSGFNKFPEWNYDASSTGQSESHGNTEGILKPIAYYKNPLRKINNYDNYLVLCETYDIEDNPLKTNNRYEALKVFNSKPEEEPWYGLEQEYFIGNIFNIENVFHHYCGVGRDKIEREIAEKHMVICLEAGLTISGINAEVATEQWEFQIGPCRGIEAADQLIIARYLLERIVEQYGVKICYDPKPSKEANGSGCHTNFSTKTMRQENGIEEIYKAIEKLEKKHDEHIKVYGEGNELRLTGEHETASYKTFSWGKGTRNTSIRIPSQVVKDKCGYFEDRRPASNMDPYLVTSIIFKTCCLE